MISLMFSLASGSPRWSRAKRSLWSGKELLSISSVVHQRSCRVHSTRNREEQLQWVAPENRRDVARVLEIAERASNSWTVTYTDFLSPPVVQDALSALSKTADLSCIAWGGYPQAERCRLAMGREDLMGVYQEDPSQLEGVAALEVKGNFMFDAATHRDFLGAAIGTGVVRDKVGDILVQGEMGAQVLVDAELVEHFEFTLKQVRTVGVTTTRIPLNALRVPPPKVKEMSSVEASMRLDAVASAGFSISRGKMADLIKAGDVKVNWRECSKASLEVKQGDVISCAGKGRVEVREVTITKKQRYAVQLVRFQ